MPVIKLSFWFLALKVNFKNQLDKMGLMGWVSFFLNLKIVFLKKKKNSTKQKRFYRSCFCFKTNISPLIDTITTQKSPSLTTTMVIHHLPLTTTIIDHPPPTSTTTTNHHLWSPPPPPTTISRHLHHHHLPSPPTLPITASHHHRSPTSNDHLHPPTPSTTTVIGHDPTINCLLWLLQPP